ncbi:uncharacterized protein LOC123534105 [Mercenaria mercenaria]|uniref:uncharacterized protein LOC123534105 n=1 Tax=Mercenaria mercenaria TaxID=6596 RepID=UPI00234E9690|nr:uncharacterized protein LOC123534105 [Mercenaria mercenaria]XP_045172115.2 uncharacterized protein LOC123534105 [Mercenaria mercenaria]XP_045172117.2 uncharacterized protein LOC123534105 [Mercenaria mercenaria]XP_045172118.2 uncharacterized protein LOC123534105 [Mercenaria mercenaria]XP_045172119.2 uncharacterized protein LOC123534105 [Mercenaria mercenaria]XP_045172120.2 uncharacterized protein LOC123534105 [Mercenaria mercenaria]
MKTKGEEVPNCTYSRIKAEKQTKARGDDNSIMTESNGSLDTQQMVDSFVQEVIQKAKTEYFRQCDENEAKSRGPKNEKRRKDKENGRLAPDKSSKKSGKDKPKHRHHYKYSDPVDEKEISEYEQQDRDSLLQWNPNFGAVTSDSRKNSTNRNGFYNRMVATFRRLLGCCFGKT